MAPRLLLVLPILLCLAILLWTQCQSKSARRVSTRIAPPYGLEWFGGGDEDDPNGKAWQRRSLQTKRKIFMRAQKEAEDEDPIHVDFEALRDEHLRRFKNSYSLLDIDSKSDESNDGPELGEPIPWFSEWEKAVAKKEVTKKGMQLLRPAKKIPNNRAQPLPSPPRFRNIREDRPCLRKRKNPVQHRTYPRSWEFPGFEVSIPREWDWRNVNGINFCSPNRNQHIPVYCGGCWVFGALGMLNDRFNVARKNRWPMTFLSPQEIIACNGHGNCTAGGTAEDVFEHAKTVGLVEEGCNNFKATDEKCTPFARCGSCWPDNCFAIQNYTRYYIKDFGKLNGRLQMMSEIHNRGPIVCSIGCTGNFDLNYTKGIYEEFGEFSVNHLVSVTGWGWDEEAKIEYWIVRNSWGDAWGENGWFRIVTSLYKNGRGDQYNMGIERDCYFADPDVSNLDQ